MINELLAKFPMLKIVYEEEGDYIKNLQHLTYSIVFVPFIRQSILANDENMIKIICDFMENMADYGGENERVLEVLGASVLESLLSEREVINVLKQFMGSKTLKLLFDMEKASGWLTENGEK